MTTDRVRKRIQTNSDNVADGLTRLQADVLELFNSQLDKYRNDMLKRDDEHVAMLKAFIDELGAVRSGLTGVSQSSSEILSAQKETQDGIAALGAQFHTLADDVADLRAGQTRLAARLDHKRQELDDHQRRLEQLELRAAEIAPEELKQLIAIVRRIAQERDVKPE